MKAVNEVGAGRILRFLWASILQSALRLTWLPPIRAMVLRLFGAKIGANSIVNGVSFINVDRGGFKALQVGANCFIGDEVMFDLASPIVIEDHVSVGQRSMILTHLNVGYSDHPLQARFPKQTAPCVIRRGSFIGAGAVVLAGTTIGPEAFVAAASLVNRDVAAGELVGGVPIKSIERRDDKETRA